MTTWFYPGQEDYITKLNDLATIANMATGPAGWSPVFSITNDGERRVLRLQDWTGGDGTKPATGSYVGSSGLVSNIALAVDIRGSIGQNGAAGPSNVLTIGTVTEGLVASASITGASPTQVLNLVLPKGDKGDKGDTGAKGDTGDAGPPNSLQIGTVVSGGTASATITGTSPSQVLNLVLPKGEKGDKGDAGTNGVDGTNGTDGAAATITVGTVTTGAPGTGVIVSNSGTSSAAVLDFTIPRGADGSGSGDVIGPASSATNNVALFADASGKLLKDGGALGTAAFSASTAFATAVQGSLADSAVQPGDLATVATTGSYNDLSSKPTIPAAQVNTDWNATSGVAQILNKPAVIAAGATQADARAAIGAGTSNLALGTTASTALAGNTVVIPDAPSDGKTYGRKNAAWAAAEPSIATSVAANYWSGDKSWRDFFASVRSATLTGLSTATNAAATATDTVLSAIGKLQAQINNRQETLVSGTNIKTLNGSSLLGAGNVVISGGVSADTGFDTVGSFCVARVASGNSAITGGSTVAGSLLRPGSFNGSSVYDNSGSGGQTLSGTWRALGQTSNSPTGFFLLFQRIA